MDVEYIQVRKDAPDIRNQFIDVYRTAFAGAPYFESRTRREVVSDIWIPHMKRGMIVLARVHGEVVGFGCAIPLRDPSVSCAHMYVRARGLPIDTSRTWYMSDLAVLSDYRGQGIGTMLVRKRLHWMRLCGSEHYVFSTISRGSHSESLYRKIGAIECGEDRETEDRYFYGLTATALSLLPAAT